jgi:DNA-binding transcriptional LysR family regulator
VVCASLKYLAERGRPEKPSDLATHDAVSFSTDAPQASKWSFSSGSRSVSVNPRIRLAVNSAEVAVAAAVAGHGVTRVLSYQVAKELRNRKLEIVLAEHEPPPIPIQVVHREGRHASARVRACVDFLVKRLRNDEALDPS